MLYIQQFLSYKSFYSLWRVLKSHLAIGIDSQVTHHVEAMEEVADQHILIKCSNCNTFQVINYLVHDFVNFNA